MTTDKKDIFAKWRPEYWQRLLAVWQYDPELLRRALRDSPAGQIVLCALLSLLVAIITLILHRLVFMLHKVAFALPESTYLSSGEGAHAVRILLIPAIGGLALGLFYLSSLLWKGRDIVDPIEANAIYGGRMSVRDSARLVLATLISNASGASIGMEAAYTQMGACVHSWFGQKLHLRREDMRIMVAAGSAAAIAAAFNAPLAGAFYGFELVLGSYIPAALPQVSIAALTGALFMRATTNNTPLFSLPTGNIVIHEWQFPLFIVLGVIAALVGITTMKAVTRCEQLARKLDIPGWLRPALGGMALSVVAIVFPQVLGNGQGAINFHFNHATPLIILLFLLMAKIIASALCIGTGFRGGLFSSSLFLGCLVGQIFGMIVGYFAPETEGQLTSFMLVGVGATGASIIGAPVTMILLVLELTGDFSATTGVLAGVLVSSAITRYCFGYSFSTWRFHLRGLRILGAHDVGWVKDITVASLLRTGMKTVQADMTLAEMRALYPAGSTKRLFVVDANECYKGVIDVAALHGDGLTPETTAMQLAKGIDRVLLPSQDIKTALKAFSKAEIEELPVVAGTDEPKLIGYVTEAYALRRYNNELETRSMMPYGAAEKDDAQQAQ